ncbi:hypothetical protein [Gorillibacterium sp. CAU 1737]|uniref:hypothetical protein n=1 Tax=Gorillibacterium sp. CAU 1737 TaxID=3140362 RepID=UPI003261B239
MNKDIEKRKLPPLLIPGIFISLFIPLWVQVLSYYFKKVTVDADVIILFVWATGGILMAIMAVNGCKWIYNEVADAIRIGEGGLRKNLAERLEDMLIRYPDEEALQKGTTYGS